MQLTKKSASTGRVLRIAMFAACGAIGLATWASALTLRTDIGAKGPDAVSSGNYQETAPDRPMPVLIHAEEVKYPAVQKKERLNGVCLIGLTVDEEGVPRDVHVVKSLRAEYDLSAIKAVERYRFKPAMNNGRAIAKNLNVEVQFVYH